MILREFFEIQPDAIQNVEDDHSKPKWGESRKTRLTLGEINKMRKMKEISSYEKAKELKSLRQMYSPAGESGPSL